MNKIKAWLASLSLAFLFFSGYSTLAVRKYASHQARGDLTAYTQGLWNSLHGNPFASTFNYSVHNYWDGQAREITEKNSNILGIHFNLILFFLLPFYFLFPSPLTPIIIQAGFVAASSVIIFLIAHSLLKQRFLSLLIQFSYLLHLALVTAVLSEFHAYPLTVLFSSLLLWFHLKNKRAGFFLSLLFLLGVQENAALPAFFFGLFLISRRHSFRRGIITISLSLFSLFITTKTLIPLFSPYHHYLFENVYGTALGSSYPEIVLNSLRHPELFLRTFFNRENFIYLGKLLLPVLPFALLSPLALGVGIFSLLPNLISSAPILKSLAMHYEAVAVPYLYFALVSGIGFVRSRFPRHLAFSLISLTLILTIGIQYKLITSKFFSPACIWSCQLYDARDAEIDEMLALVPAGASVSTQDYLSGHLANRPRLYLFPVAYREVEYLPLSKGDETWPIDPARHRQLVRELRNNPDYEIVFESSHYLLFHHVR